MTTTILPNSGPDTGETTAHWFELNTTAAPVGLITLADQGNIGGEDIAANTTTFFPSVAVNSQGTAKFGFSASAPTIFAGAFVTGREAGDPPGTVQASMTVHAGEDFYVRTFGGPENRWGDYSGISLDPTDDNVFWVFNQFADDRGTILPPGEDGRWGTAWAACVVAGPLDHFLSYKVKRTKKTPKFVKRVVSLADQFETKDFKVKKPKFLLTPADKGGEGINDPVHHLKAYKIKKTKGQGKHVKQKNIKVDNQFGTIFVDTKKPDLLLVPTLKDPDNPVVLPEPFTPPLDHFKCYRVRRTKGTSKFTPETVNVSDQFINTTLLVKKPVRLCVPVDKDGKGIIDPVAHLMCYKVKRVKKKVKGIHVNNQFGPEQLDTKKVMELCVPSTKTP